jgi:hypothetical protein
MQPPYFDCSLGRAIAQAISHWLSTAAARVRSQVKSRGICGGQSGAGASFLWVLRFPLPILIPPTAPCSSSIVRGWHNRPVSGRRTMWTHSQSHPTPRNLTEDHNLNFIAAKALGYINVYPVSQANVLPTFRRYYLPLQGEVTSLWPLSILIAQVSISISSDKFKAIYRKLQISQNVFGIFLVHII